MKKYAKIAALLMAFVLVIAGTVGVTMALLTDTSETVTNTFTIGNVNISLAENTTDDDYKLIPGNTISKDPKVTVEAGSEDCWIFVKLVVDNTLMDVLTLDYNADWEVKSSTEGATSTVIILQPKATKAAGNVTSVFGNDDLLVNKNATNTQITAANNGKIVITAYAVQAANVLTVDAAYTELSALINA